MKKTGRTQVSGADAFKLHDTYGVIIDITQQMAQEQGLTVDVPGFEKAMGRHSEKRGQGGKKFVVDRGARANCRRRTTSPKYATALIAAKVLGWVKDNTVVTSGQALRGRDGRAAARPHATSTPSRAGRSATLAPSAPASGADFEVEDTQRLGDTVLHVGTLHEGELAVGDTVMLEQGIDRRIDIMRNHTATHLLNLALREVLGDARRAEGFARRRREDAVRLQPRQADDRRSSFSEIERRVNTSVGRDQPVTAVVMPLDEAKELPGVRAVFGEKYPDPVRVVMIGAETPEQATADMSVEFCGGTHVPRTGSIGYFKILSQEGVAKGIRRITAVTGQARVRGRAERAARSWTNSRRTSSAARTNSPGRVDALQDQVKKLQEQLKKAVGADADRGGGRTARDAPGRERLEAGGREVARRREQRHRAHADRPRAAEVRVGVRRVRLERRRRTSVSLLAAVTPDLVKKGLKAGDVVKPAAEAIGGKGGGKPDMAQAGGKEPAKLQDALKKAEQMGRELLGK